MLLWLSCNYDILISLYDISVAILAQAFLLPSLHVQDGPAGGAVAPRCPCSVHFATNRRGRGSSARQRGSRARARVSSICWGGSQKTLVHLRKFPRRPRRPPPAGRRWQNYQPQRRPPWDLIRVEGSWHRLLLEAHDWFRSQCYMAFCTMHGRRRGDELGMEHATFGSCWGYQDRRPQVLSWMVLHGGWVCSDAGRGWASRSSSDFLSEPTLNRIVEGDPICAEVRIEDFGISSSLLRPSTKRRHTAISGRTAGARWGNCCCPVSRRHLWQQGGRFGRCG